MLRLMKYMGVAVCLLLSAAVQGQDVEFNVEAPSVVASGEAFRIEFSLNAKPSQFTPPATFSGVDVLAGPTLSEGTSVSIINNNVTKKSSYTYTYVLQANAVGNATISGATATVDGKTYSTKPVNIEVVDGGSQSAGSGGGQSAQTGFQSSNRVGADDLLVRVTVDRHTAYKGQPVRAVFKIYTRVQLGRIENIKFPAFNGFWTQELDVSGYDWQRETLNGKDYSSRVIKEVLLYPQQSGQLHIEQFSVTAVAQIVVQSQRPQSLFDDFFGGGQQIQEVRKDLVSSPIAITVKDFPAGAPASFNGAVGQFQMSGSLDNQSVSANGSNNLVLKLSGNGNLPLIQAPDIQMPSSFEQYNKKTTESLTHNANGITGYRQFEYPFIPRAEGRYTIGPVEFSYFDPSAAKYVTLSTAVFNVEVRPDSTGTGLSGGGVISGINKEDLKILDRDIRFIRIDNPGLRRIGNVFFGSLWYFIALLLILAACAGGYHFLKKHLQDVQNTILIRNRKANKVALQRLKMALQYMENGEEKPFYEEVLRAFWGYMSDKLNIPVSNLTKDNIREELQKRGVAPEQIARFIDTITTCEYAQYSPSASGQMSEVYRSAAAILSKLESVIKK